MISYRIGIDPYHDSENEHSSEEVIFEFERIGGYSETWPQITIHLAQPGYRAYPREITLRGDGLRALYHGLKRLIDPSSDEND